MSNLRDQDKEIDAAAAEWVIKTESGDFGPEDRLALDRWRAADPRHEEAYEFAHRTWGELRRLEMPGNETAVASQSSSVARRSTPGRHTAKATKRLPARSGRIRTWLSVAAMLVIATVSMGYVLTEHPIAVLFADHQTGPGDIETVSLPDGSVVVLNARSAIDVGFDTDSRTIRLLAGEADFSVAPDSARPFVVVTDEMNVRALGTRFIVQQRDAGSKVTVLEHRIEVSVKSGGIRRLALGPGMSVTISADDVLSPITEENLEHAIAWQQGRLVFDRRPLADVLYEIDRHQGGRTILLSEGLKEKTVSGVFRINDLEMALDGIARELGLERTQVIPGVAILH